MIYWARVARERAGEAGKVASGGHTICRFGDAGRKGGREGGNGIVDNGMVHENSIYIAK